MKKNQLYYFNEPDYSQNSQNAEDLILETASCNRTRRHLPDFRINYSKLQRS